MEKEQNKNEELVFLRNVATKSPERRLSYERRKPRKCENELDKFWDDNAKKYLSILNIFEINKIQMITKKLINERKYFSCKREELLDFIKELVKEDEQCKNLYLFILSYPVDMLICILYTALDIINENMQESNRTKN